MDEETPAAPVCTCKEKCAAGAVDTSCPVCKTNLSECAGREKVRELEPEPEQPKKKSGSGLLAVVALVALAGGGAFAYVKFIKPNRSGVKVSADPDEYDFPDEEYINEVYYFFVTGHPGTDVAGQYFYAKTADEHYQNCVKAGWAS